MSSPALAPLPWGTVKKIAAPAAIIHNYTPWNIFSATGEAAEQIRSTYRPAGSSAKDAPLYAVDPKFPISSLSFPLFLHICNRFILTLNLLFRFFDELFDSGGLSAGQLAIFQKSRKKLRHVPAGGALYRIYKKGSCPPRTTAQLLTGNIFTAIIGALQIKQRYLESDRHPSLIPSPSQCCPASFSGDRHFETSRKYVSTYRDTQSVHKRKKPEYLCLPA